MKKHRIASLFSGCGGADLGMLGGFWYLGKYYKPLNTSIIFANDVDKFASETYLANFPNHNYICEDLRKISSKYIPNHDVLVGGFPCQSFSIVGQRQGLSDLRGQLFMEMKRVLKDKKPLAFIGENVKGLANLQKGKVLDFILKHFDEAGYNLTYKILNSSNYGIPQKRERIFIIGFRKDIQPNFKFPEEQAERVPLKTVLQNTFEDKYIFSKRAVEGLKRANKAFNKGRVQKLNEPCNTINSHLAKVSLNGTDPVLLIDGKKDCYRRFTPLEAARIQSFPDIFKFPVSEFQTYKQIGNAIPPVLMWHLTREIINSIKHIPIRHTKNKNTEKPVYFEDMPLFQHVNNIS